MSLSWDKLDQMRPQSEWRLPLPPTCPKCEYNLTGLSADRCPECGSTFRWKELRTRASHVWTLTRRLKHANQDATFGLIMALSGWFVVGFVRLVRWDAVMLLVDGIAVIIGLLTIILGSQVLNIRRVPKWARSYVAEPPPSLRLGAGVIVLGFTLLIGPLLIP